jgi:hypothetical protein
VRTTPLGLFALLTDTLLATPTMAFAVATSSVLPSLLAWISARFSPSLLAECGGLDKLCSLCRGEGASRGAEDGCDDSALSLVTLGCFCEGERMSGEVGTLLTARVSLFTAFIGFEQISHSGSRSSRCSVMGLG